MPRVRTSAGLVTFVLVRAVREIGLAHPAHERFGPQSHDLGAKSLLSFSGLARSALACGVDLDHWKAGHGGPDPLRGGRARPSPPGWRWQAIWHVVAGLERRVRTARVRPHRGRGVPFVGGGADRAPSASVTPASAGQETHPGGTSRAVSSQPPTNHVQWGGAPHDGHAT